MNTIEAIRAEIERRIKEYDAIIESQPDSNRSERDAWKWAEDKSLLSFIDSMPEEPAPKGYDEAYLNDCIAKASKTWEGVDVDKYMDEVRGNRPKLSDNLEEAAEKEMKKETITEIKTIKLELNTDGRYNISINGDDCRKVGYNVPADNYRQWARIFTRMAMEMWASMDAHIEKDKEDER